MLTALQNQQYKTGEPLTDKQIAHIMIALLMAGQHTSAATGAWAILRLGEFPDLQRRLYAEQVEHFYDAATGTWRELEYDTLQTPLLMAFIKELLRCHPPLHSLMRKIILDCPVPTTVGSPAAEPGQSSSWRKRTEGVEYVVPRGEFVLAAPGYSQVDEGIWGPDAKEFRPERWMDQGEGGRVPGEEDEGEEDYGWGKISKGGKSACASLLPLSLFSSRPRRLVEPLADPPRRRPPARSQTSPSAPAATAASASSLPTSSSAPSSRRSCARTSGRSTRSSPATTTRCVPLLVLPLPLSGARGPESEYARCGARLTRARTRTRRP